MLLGERSVPYIQKNILLYMDFGTMDEIGTRQLRQKHVSSCNLKSLAIRRRNSMVFDLTSSRTNAPNLSQGNFASIPQQKQSSIAKADFFKDKFS